MEKKRKTIRSSILYIVILILILAIVALGARNIYLDACLHSENRQLRQKLDEIYNDAKAVLVNQTPQIITSDKSVNVTFNLKKDKEEAVGSITEALSIMQDQVNAHDANLTLILTIFIAAISAFGIVVPIYNYIFLNKEQVAQINQSIESTKKESQDQFAKYKEEFSNQLEEAREEYSKQQECFETKFNEQLNRMMNLIAQNMNVTAAMIDDKKISDIEPISNDAKDQAQSFYIKGVIAFKNNDLENALTFFNNAIELDPENGKYHDNLSLTLWQLGKYENAFAESRKAVLLEPESARNHNNLGGMLQAVKKYKDALVEIREAVKLEPQKCLCHYNLGAILLTMKEYSEAYSEAMAAIRLEPDNVDNKILAGMALYRLKKCSEAIQYLNSVIERGNESAVAYIYRGLAKVCINFQQGSFDNNGAFDDILRGIKINPKDSHNHLSLAQGYFLAGYLDRTEEALKEAEELDKTDPEIYHLYALICEKRGDEPKAKEYQKKADELGYIPEPE